MSGQRRAPCPPRCHDRRADLGVLHSQAEDNSAESPQQGTHDHENPTTTAKGSLHRASNLEPTSLRCRTPRHLNVST
jgi:hypothetical protein